MNHVLYFYIWYFRHINKDLDKCVNKLWKALMLPVDGDDQKIQHLKWTEYGA